LLDIRISVVYSVAVDKYRMIDKIDTQILAILQNDARISNAEIARQVGLAPSAVLERVRKMEERGIIRGYSTDIDPHFLDFGLTAFVAVRTSECGGPAEAALASVPEVLEVHDVAGEDSYWLKIRTKDTEALGKLLREKIKPIPTVLGTRTTVVLETYKETKTLPIEEKPKAEGKKAKR
jgi:Lrp/AsnC family leucine-responsive transcriptional regulator